MEMPSPNETPGRSVEREVRQIAALLGVADFVYAAPQVAKGTAVREIGDGLLIVGSRGAILQVKSREPDRRDSDTPEKAESWTKKHAAKALKQGRGTRDEIIRRVAAGEKIHLTPVRALGLPDERRRRYDLVLDHDVSAWPIIIIIDHPKADGVDLGFEPDCVYLTLNDWRQLQRRLRSVSSTLTYIERSFEHEAHVPLGNELIRYCVFYDADVNSSGDMLFPSVPHLQHPFDFDELGPELFHDVMEKVWHDDGVLPWGQASEYRSIVEFMDRVPPSLQSVFGEWFHRKRREIANGKHRASGVAIVSHSDRLVYTCSHLRSWPLIGEWQTEVMALAMLRHEHALASGAPADSITLAVGALVEDRPPDTGVGYMFALIQGSDGLPKLPFDMKRGMEWRYGVFHQERGDVRELLVPRKSLCPCGSGKKFKNCHESSTGD